jgi:hypothetical protein
MTAPDKRSPEFLRRQPREYLAEISTPESPLEGGRHSAHIHNKGKHRTNSEPECDLCEAAAATVRNQSKEDANGI